MAKKVLFFLVILLVLLGATFALFYYTKKTGTKAEGLTPTLKVNPEGGTFKVGDRIVLKIIISAPQKIKSAKAVLNINLSEFKIEKIDKGALTNYHSPEIINSQNRIKISAYENVDSGGWSGENLLASINLIALKSTDKTDLVVNPSESEIILTSGESVAIDTNQASFIIESNSSIKPQVDLKINGSDQEIKLAKGSTATLTWSVKNTDSCSASNAWQGEKAIDGQETTGELNTNSTFVLSCSNSAGSAIDSVSVVVLTELPKLNLNIDGEKEKVIKSGESIKLNWEASPEDVNCRTIGGWEKTISAPGSKEITNITIAQTYSIICENNIGRVFDSVKVKVGETPPSVEIKANNISGPLVIEPDASFQLEWSSNAISCEAGGDWFGTKPPIGIELVNKIDDFKNYQLTCSNNGLSSSDNVIVSVRKVLGENEQPSETVESLNENEQPANSLPQNILLENNSSIQKNKIIQSATVKTWIIIVFYIIIPFGLTAIFILIYWYVKLKGYSFRKKNGTKNKTNRKQKK